MKKIWFFLLLSSLLLLGCQPRNLPDEVSSYVSGLEREIDVDAVPLVEEIDANAFIDSIVREAPGRLDLRLPNYAYFQGIVQADKFVVLAGQVRVVGGVLGVDDPNGAAALYSGAMVTANPEAFLEADDTLIGGDAGLRTRVRSWREIPTR